MKVETLIVDDDPIVCLIHKKLLSASGLAPDARVFKNGLDALNFLRESYTPEIWYVILLDLNMPVMDGYEFLNEIKEVFPTNNIRVQVVSSSVCGEDRNQALAFPHVCGFLEKPLNMARLTEPGIFPER